ncbi:hypothetical protein PHMEG_00016407 [Phytophthora megakarya]|uniref:Uncharacterized protein n=1 Tax=Phytophthora megakarya TaxID=4795 RepID=A0A225W1I1_9STRA|nr:hypothetical protein PHMEG_00016407 [Phytophthora megakarya]
MQPQAQMLELTADDFAQVRNAQHVPLQHVYNVLTYNMLTCVLAATTIWHFQSNNGNDRPRPRCGRDIQNREAVGSTGKRKRRSEMTTNDQGTDASFADDGADDSVEEEDEDSPEKVVVSVDDEGTQEAEDEDIAPAAADGAEEDTV